jgi:DNA-binding NarL/FixJ family response regulator
MKLSQRERDVLIKIAYGFTDKEIALSLKISIRTVQTHVTSIIKKLQARNRANAVAIYCGIYPRWKAGKGKI